MGNTVKCFGKFKEDGMKNEIFNMCIGETVSKDDAVLFWSKTVLSVYKYIIFK